MFISLTETLSFKHRGVENRMFYIIQTGQKEFLPHDYIEYSIEIFINNLVLYTIVKSKMSFDFGYHSNFKYLNYMYLLSIQYHALYNLMIYLNSDQVRVFL